MKTWQHHSLSQFTATTSADFIHWIHWRRETAGHYFCLVNGTKEQNEFSFDSQAQLRRVYENLIDKYQLISIAPDIAVNPKKVDVIDYSKEGITILFADDSERFSAERFVGEHEKIQKLKIQQLLQASGIAVKNWLFTHDDYHVVLVRHDVLSDIKQQGAFIHLEFPAPRSPYRIAWQDAEEAHTKLVELQKKHKEYKEII